MYWRSSYVLTLKHTYTHTEMSNDLPKVIQLSTGRAETIKQIFLFFLTDTKFIAHTKLRSHSNKH